MREMYKRYKFPVKYAGRGNTEVTFEEMFVDLRIQMFEYSKQHQECLAHRDIEKIQKAKRSGKGIECTQLLEVLDDKVAPHSVLIQGITGVGKTTLVKQMAKQWAEKKMWTQIRYLFVISLSELQQNRDMTLEGLLFDRMEGLSLTDEERKLAMEQIQASREQVVVFLEGADELRSFQYTDQYERRCEQKADINTLISSLIHGAMLPGAKIVITTRPIDQLTSKVCSRVTELFGFTEENIKNYVHKFSGDNPEIERLIQSYLQKNPNIATFCYIPATCNFVCMCVQGMRTEDMAAVRTMTQLYVYAIIHLVTKRHPKLKDNPKNLDSEAIFNVVGLSLKNHAKVAKCGTMTYPLKLGFNKEDIKDITDEDRQSRFLEELMTMDPLTRDRSQQCRSFTHLMIQQFFTAVGLLMGPVDEIPQLTESRESIRKQEVVLTFVVGLLCDQRNANLMEYFRTGESQPMPSAYEPRTFLENLATKTDPLQLITLVHETQREDLADVVPADIQVEHVTPTEMASLVWVLQQPKCSIVRLT